MRPLAHDLPARTLRCRPLRDTSPSSWKRALSTCITTASATRCGRPFAGSGPSSPLRRLLPASCPRSCCSQVLWQLFHYVPLNLDSKLAETHTLQMQWEAYKLANQARPTPFSPPRRRRPGQLILLPQKARPVSSPVHPPHSAAPSQFCRLCALQPAPLVSTAARGTGVCQGGAGYPRGRGRRLVPGAPGSRAARRPRASCNRGPPLHVGADAALPSGLPPHARPRAPEGRAAQDEGRLVSAHPVPLVR